MRVVFDTNVVVSALLFRGALSWLVEHWRDPRITLLLCHETAHELARVLAYPKFGLSLTQVDIALSRYLPFGERIVLTSENDSLPRCRDAADQIFLRLAVTGRADVLVSGDPDLLALKESVGFVIETPVEYGRRWMERDA